MIPNSIAIYDKASIQNCPWPADDAGMYAKEFLEPLIAHGASHFVDNVNAKMAVLIVDNIALPLTINESSSCDSSYVSSPYSQYVSYAPIVSKKIENKFLRFSFDMSLKLYGWLMRLGEIDKVVIVNNWLLSTNPYPKLDTPTVKKIGDFLKKLFPKHAIVFRSINQQTCQECYEALIKNGYDFIVSKYIYITDGADSDIFKTRIFKSDLNFVRNCPYRLAPLDEIQEREISTLHGLYKALYVEKYSQYNPQYNVNFFKLMFKLKTLNFLIAKQDEELEGLAVYYFFDGKMISPVFGYDPTNSEKKGIYRYLSTALLLEAQKNRAIFNQSAGGSFFKKIRRAKGDMEYTAVDGSHLPYYRRIPWKLLSMILNTLGRPVMEKY